MYFPVAFPTVISLGHRRSLHVGFCCGLGRASPVPNQRTSLCYHPFWFDGRVSLTVEFSYPVYNPYSYQRTTDPTVVWRSNENKQAFVLAGNYDSPDFVCHVDSSPASDFVEVNAGDSLNLKWTNWPVSHIGPIITYIANAKGDFSQVDKVNLPFVKIEELGLIHNSTDKKNKPEGYYAANKLIDAGNHWTIKIPDYVAPGNYIVRHEIIALMGAIHLDHAQHYPQCINVKVTGKGKDPIARGTRAKDLYKATDPGIQIMIYKDLDYHIPGPKLYKPSGASPANFYETEAAVSSAQPTPATPVGLPSSTPISVGLPLSTPISVGLPLSTPISVASSAPYRATNATAFPPYHHKPTQTPAAASTPSSKPVNNPNTGKADEYTYDFSGLNGDQSATEAGAVEDSGANQTEGNHESASSGNSQGTTDGGDAGPSKETPKQTGPGQTGGQKTYNYNGLGQETHPKATPTYDDASSSFSPADFDLPKNATVEQLIAFLEKLLKKLKAKALNTKRRYARDFSMH